ncbi:MAG: helix-turn-helix domain-containing protein, partial [Pyrinomonadaceae bacterium]
AYSNAGLAALTLIEEHGKERLSSIELYQVYRRADELLKDTQDDEDIARLRACARIVTRKLLGVRLSDKNFSLPKAIFDYEERFIREALELEQGSVTRAAKRLGVKHQTLTHLLNKHHTKLLSLRTPPVSRKQGIIREGKKR